MDGETAARLAVMGGFPTLNNSSCPSDIMVAKVYGESETPSTSLHSDCVVVCQPLRGLIRLRLIAGELSKKINYFIL